MRDPSVSKVRADGQQVRAVLAVRKRRKRGRMRIGDDEQVERLDARFCASGMRGIVLPPWPNTIIALMLSFWSTSSDFWSTASNQRVDGIPGVSMFCFAVRAGRPALAGTSSNRDRK